MYDLAVLNPPSQVIWTFQVFSIYIQYHPDCRITDSMGVDLVAMINRLLTYIAIIIKVGHYQAAVSRIITIWLQHAGSPGTKRPISKKFKTIHMESVRLIRTLADKLMIVVLIGSDPDIHPHLQGIILHQ